MNLRRVLPALLLLPLALHAAAAQVRHIDAAAEPSVLFTDPATGRLNLLTAGVDQNFDGIFEADSGDIAPRWMVIDPATERVVDSASFDGFFNSFPIRVGIDYGHRLLFASIGDHVRSYDIGTLRIARDTVALGAYAAVSYDSLANRLILAARPGFTDPGYLVTLDAATGDTVMIVETGVNPGMSATRWSSNSNASEQYTLIEGSFTSASSQIAYSALQPDVFAGHGSGGLGGGGNQIVVRGERAYVVMNGTHQIRIINTRTHKDATPSPIAVGTTGFDGPRALAFQNDSVIVVATYSGDLRRFNVGTGAMIDSIAMPGKVEAVAVRDSLAFAAIEYAAGTYNYDSLVVVVNLTTGLPVDTIAAGLNPAALFIDARGDLQVVIADTVSSAQRLVLFDHDTYAMKGTRQLPGVLTFPIRVAYDPAADSLYMLLSDSVVVYPAASVSAPGRVAYADGGKGGVFQSVTLDGGNLLVTERPKDYGTGPGYVHVVRRADAHRLATFRAGTFVSMAARIVGERDSSISYYALNEGNFTSASSTLTLFEYQPNVFGADTLGKGANHLLMSGPTGIVTMNGNNSVVGADLDNWQILLRIPIGTSGFDGPRESMLLNTRTLAVTTYAGDVRVINTDAPGAIRTFNVGGRAEGIAMAGGKVFAALPFDLSPTYTPGMSVAVIDSELAASVKRQDLAASATTLDQNYPNPVSEGTSIRFGIAAGAHVTLQIFSATGELAMTVVDGEMERGVYTADLKVGGLPSGSYIYTLRAGSVAISHMMKVVR